MPWSAWQEVSARISCQRSRRDQEQEVGRFVYARSAFTECIFRGSPRVRTSAALVVFLCFGDWSRAFWSRRRERPGRFCLINEVSRTRVRCDDEAGGRNGLFRFRTFQFRSRPVAVYGLPSPGCRSPADHPARTPTLFILPLGKICLDEWPDLYGMSYECGAEGT